MPTLNEVVEALKQCKDPELDANIVDLGLIYGIKMTDDGVKVTLTMTSAMCPVTSLILADAQLRLEAVPGIGKVELELVWDPMWSPDMMSDEIKYKSQASPALSRISALSGSVPQLHFQLHAQASCSPSSPWWQRT